MKNRLFIGLLLVSLGANAVLYRIADLRWDLITELRARETTVDKAIQVAERDCAFILQAEKRVCLTQGCLMGFDNVCKVMARDRETYEYCMNKSANYCNVDAD